MLQGTSLGGHSMQVCLWSKLRQVAVSFTQIKFPPADNLIKAKNDLPVCTDTFLTEWVSSVSK